MVLVACLYIRRDAPSRMPSSFSACAYAYQAEASLAEVRAAAEGEMERAATRRDAVIQERDRTLEQASSSRLLQRVSRETLSRRAGQSMPVPNFSLCLQSCSFPFR